MSQKMYNMTQTALKTPNIYPKTFRIGLFYSFCAPKFDDEPENKSKPFDYKKKGI